MNQQLVLICQHWFEYETPDGKFSEGVCKYCGAVDYGRNSMPEYAQARGLGINKHSFDDALESINRSNKRSRRWKAQ